MRIVIIILSLLVLFADCAVRSAPANNTAKFVLHIKG